MGSDPFAVPTAIADMMRQRLEDQAEIARLRAALGSARYELRNYVKDDMGYKNGSVVDCIEEIDAALAPRKEV